MMDYCKQFYAIYRFPFVLGNFFYPAVYILYFVLGVILRGKRQIFSKITDFLFVEFSVILSPKPLLMMRFDFERYHKLRWLNIGSLLGNKISVFVHNLAISYNLKIWVVNHILSKPPLKFYSWCYVMVKDSTRVDSGQKLTIKSRACCFVFRYIGISSLSIMICEYFFSWIFSWF